MSQKISGEQLAHRLGITRANVWKHIHALKQWGIPILGSPRQGYHMSSAFDFSLIAAKNLKQKINKFRIHYDFISESTQVLARAAASQGAPEGSLWITETQTRGQGRLERAWMSGIGGLWFSLLLRPRFPPVRVPPLTLVAGLTMAQAIESLWNIPVRLKWPNDLLLKTAYGWRKVGGILTEMVGEMDHTHWAIIGIGVNVNNEIPASLQPIASSLNAKKGVALPRQALLDLWVLKFWKAYSIYQKHGFEIFRKPYWAFYGRPNEAVHLRTSQGDVRGITRGIDGSGALLVEFNHQIKPIWEGEIV